MNALAPVPEGESIGLAKYEAACRAVAEAATIDEAKHFRNEADAMRAYAKMAKDRQMETQAAELRIRAERRIGEIMAAQREAGFIKPGNPEGFSATNGSAVDPLAKPPTLAEVGIDKHLADRARKLAALPESKFEDTLTEWRDDIAAANEKVTVNLFSQKKVRGTQGTGENEWYTPQEYVEKARAVMGAFDVDPASNDEAQKAVQAGQYFTAETDGLAQEWHGRVWMNPPYAQPLISDFMGKLCEEYRAGRCLEAIALTHNYTDTRWFQDTAALASAICFTRGRIRFYSPSGEIAAPTQGQAFFYLGPNVEAFRREFASVGFVVEVLK